MTRVLVVGAGTAGVAAAWAARRGGASVTVVANGAGASMMTSGAVDDEAWDAPGDRPISTLDALSLAFAADLDVWRIGSRCARVATGAGVLRPARGTDLSVLDLDGFRDQLIAIPRAPRPGWDADALTRALGDETFAKERSLRFVAIDAPVLRYDDESTIPDVDLASRHDDRPRGEWLAEQLRAARRAVDFSAVLVGPWLGATRAAAPDVSRLAGVTVGEILSSPGGAAGSRLGAALDRVLASTGAQIVRGAARVTGSDGVYRVEHVDLSGSYDAVVLATGGVVAGGVVLTRVDPTIIGGPSPHFIAPAWAEAALGWRREDLSLPPSAALPDLRWQRENSVIEQIGIQHREGRAVDATRSPRRALFVAGDVRANEPRTILAAVRSGLSAGARAAT